MRPTKPREAAGPSSPPPSLSRSGRSNGSPASVSTWVTPTTAAYTSTIPTSGSWPSSTPISHHSLSHTSLFPTSPSHDRTLTYVSPPQFEIYRAVGLHRPGVGDAAHHDSAEARLRLQDRAAPCPGVPAGTQ